MCVILPFVSCVVKLEGNRCGRLVDKSGDSHPSLDALQPVVVVGRHSRIAELHATLRADESVPCVCALHTVDGGSVAHPVDSRGKIDRSAIGCSVFEETPNLLIPTNIEEIGIRVGLREAEGLAALILRESLHGDHSTFRFMRCQARGEVVWVSCG